MTLLAVVCSIAMDCTHHCAEQEQIKRIIQNEMEKMKAQSVAQGMHSAEYVDVMRMIEQEINDELQVCARGLISASGNENHF